MNSKDTGMQDIIAPSIFMHCLFKDAGSELGKVKQRAPCTRAWLVVIAVHCRHELIPNSGQHVGERAAQLRKLAQQLAAYGGHQRVRCRRLAVAVSGDRVQLAAAVERVS